MNLMNDKWIPVRRLNGIIEDVAPYEVTDKIDNNPIIALAAPRPDFNGALIQFLIGLFQTIYAPKSESEWEDRMVKPPKPADLKKLTDKVAFAFEMFGPGPRFMQDMTLKNDSTSFEISSLFIDSPGENTKKLRKDFFVKDGAVQKISDKTAAMALFCFQTNSPSGGQGHLTSVRGGGPLTTIVKLKSERINLWSDTWLNVLVKNSFRSKFADDDWAQIFPWANPKIQKMFGKGKTASANLFHPYSIFWACPRRIQLVQQNETSECDIARCETHTTVRNYYTQNYGLSYGEGGWMHPLSPYYKNKESLLPLHPQPGGFLYTNWPILALGSSENGQIAKVVTTFLAKKPQEIHTVIHAFGYDMDNMKARCWYEAEIPFYQIPEQHLTKFEEQISQILGAADSVKRNLRQAVKNAWFSERQSVKGDFGHIDISFLKQTESSFFEILQNLLAQLKAGQTDFVGLKEEWLKFLVKQSFVIFDEVTGSGSLEFEDIQKLVEARKNLGLFNFSSVTKKALGLPYVEKTKTRSAKKI